MKDVRFLLNQILFHLRLNRKYFFKLFFCAFLIIWVGWNYLGVRNFTYKRLYGKPTGQVLTIWDKEQILDYDEPLQNAVFNGYPVTKSFKKKYALSGILVYHDDNTTFWKKHFWNSGDEIGKTYNKIASHDLTIVWGKTASPDNLKKIKVGHELNLALLECTTCNCYFGIGDFNNFHIIPANERLNDALSVLPRSKKVPIYVEGYLTDWYGTGDYQDLKMDTALDARTTSRQKAGGGKTGLCYQLYLTKFIYDGYTFE